MKKKGGKKKTTDGGISAKVQLHRSVSGIATRRLSIGHAKRDNGQPIILRFKVVSPYGGDRRTAVNFSSQLIQNCSGCPSTNIDRRQCRGASWLTVAVDQQPRIVLRFGSTVVDEADE